VDMLQRSRPKDAEVIELAGRCQEGLGKFPEAVELYNQAREVEPGRIEVYGRLARVLRQRLSDPAGADKVMDASAVAPGGLIATNGNSAKAYLARARYREEFNIPGADDDVAEALKVAPDDVEVLLAAALLERDRNVLDLARKHLEHALEV